MENKYFLGLDIGTNSVGWAVTDDKYKLHKYKAHKMWGSRLFDQGSTAAERRIFRSNRRRLERRKQRLKILQEIFSEEISKVDPGFFQRIEDSKFYVEDKKIKEKHVFFDGNDYNDIQYYQDFPTIYHLRDHLMHSHKKEDIRLIYLACHHILKNRGHFLYGGSTFNRSETIEKSLKEILNHPEILSGNIENQEALVKGLIAILLHKKSTKNDKKKRIKGIVSSQNFIDKNIYTETLSLCIGSKIDISKIFGEEEVAKDEVKLSFQDTVYEEVRDDIETILGSKIDLIDACKKLYDGIILNEIIEDNQSFSQSKINSYNKHKEDLNKLKSFVRKNMSKTEEIDDYKKIFRLDQEKGKNYINYIGKSKEGKKITAEEFYKFLKNILKKYDASSVKDEILNEIELGQFLPLQKQKENSVIPYQMHKEELIAILSNAATYYKFLNEKDNDVSNSEKIISLLEFRIPYYVGPLNDYHKKFSWLKKNGSEPIRPWNFDEIVDKSESAEIFINRMTNKCTYLRTEDVLPKQSLLYSEYSLLNEINTITCDGRRLSSGKKRKFIEDNFINRKNNRKITKKRVLEWFIMNGLATSESVVAGIDNEIKGDLKSYREFKNILGNQFEYEMCEDIIRWITVFGDTKNLLKSKILKEYGDKLTKVHIERITKLRYKEWGRLSKKFLTEIYSDMKIDYETGEYLNIINTMRLESLNLNEVLTNGNGYDVELNRLRADQYSVVDKVSYQLVEDLHLSPAVKRSIWQTILLTEEIKKIKGSDPSAIFLEMTRENENEQKKQRNSTKRNARKEQLIQLYKNCKDCTEDWTNELKNVEDDKLRSKKLYLYYLQDKKSAYSDEIIDLHDLMTNNSKYDIDHIWPRSRTKDDSFDNLVLCLKSENRDKGDKYPVDNVIQEKKQAEWNRLYRNGFMSSKKYERLMRKEEFKPEELSGFINRQLVETSQSTKAVADLLKQIYPETEIVYVKASNVTEFRYAMYKELNRENINKTGLFYKYPKNRVINDFHHAKDAYLNIVVGNVYNCKFTKNPANFIKNTDKKYLSLTALYKYKIKRGNYTAWTPGEKGSQETIRKEMNSNDVRITKKLKEGKGGLFDANLIKAKNTKESSYLPIKKSDERYINLKRYGGYKNVTNSYYTICKYKILNNKGELEEKTCIKFIPLYLKEELNNDECKKAYLREDIKLKKNEELVNIEILYSKLRLNSKIKINGMFYRIGGKTNEKIYIDNAIPLILDIEWDEYSKILDKEIEKVKNKEEFNRRNIVTEEKNNQMFDYLTNKLETSIYKKMKSFKLNDFLRKSTKEKFVSLDILEQSKILLQIINVMTNRVTTYNMKSIGMSTSRATIGTNLSNLEEFSVIEESVTGLNSKKVEIIGAK